MGSAAAKRLVYPEGDAAASLICEPDERIVRVVFNGNKAAATPLIAHMAVERGIEANIAYASTRTIDGKQYGSMLLGIRGGENAVREAIDYLVNHNDIMAEEVEL